MANEQSAMSRVADREKLPLLLDKARQFAGQYIESLEERPVLPSEKSLRSMHALLEPSSLFPWTIRDACEIIKCEAGRSGELELGVRSKPLTFVALSDRGPITPALLFNKSPGQTSSIISRL